jgi:ribosomal protein S18 acetylase RimI-like enzyme
MRLQQQMPSPLANNLAEQDDPVILAAIPEMAPVAGRLIYMTMGIVADYLFGAGDEARAEAVLGRMFPVRQNLFSYEFADMAMLGAQPTGIVLTFPVRTMRSLELPTAYLLWRTSGLSTLVGMIVRSWSLAGAKEAEADEYFVPHLAVLPAFQGRGLGKLLLGHAELKAKLAGFPTIALTVEVGNERAIELYSGHGFHLVDTCTFPDLEKRIGYRGFHRMAKSLV